MELRGILGGAYRVTEWMMRLAWLNIVWLIFVVAGLFLFGLLPSTVAMFAVTRKWIMGEDKDSILTSFWKVYKKEFVRSNQLGLILFLVGAVIYLDWRFFHLQEGILYHMASFGIIGFALLFVTAVFYMFPVYAHYDLSPLKSLRLALFLGVSHPLLTVGMIACSVIAYEATLSFPGVFFFYSGSVLSYSIMWMAKHSFDKNESAIGGSNIR